jgi:RNA polymerase sigma factor (sigma-70 family)
MEDLSGCRSRQDLLHAALILAPELTRYLIRKSPGATDAQDLMQDVYVRILKIKNLRGIEQPRAYLYKVAACVAYEHRKHFSACPPHVTYDEVTSDEARLADLSYEPNEPESAAAASERLDALDARLNELSPRVRDALLWDHRDGYTCDEIAEKLSAATHRVKKYLNQGFGSLPERGSDAGSGLGKLTTAGSANDASGPLGLPRTPGLMRHLGIFLVKMESLLTQRRGKRTVSPAR